MTISEAELSRRQFLGKVGAVAALPLLAAYSGTDLRLERINGRQPLLDLWMNHDPASRNRQVNQRI